MKLTKHFQAMLTPGATGSIQGPPEPTELCTQQGRHGESKFPVEKCDFCKSKNGVRTCWKHSKWSTWLEGLPNQASNLSSKNETPTQKKYVRLSCPSKLPVSPQKYKPIKPSQTKPQKIRKQHAVHHVQNSMFFKKSSTSQQPPQKN